VKGDAEGDVEPELETAEYEGAEEMRRRLGTQGGD
jgi:hypothetical protein